MDLLTILAIATGLSFDTFAVSLSCGLVRSGIKISDAVRIAMVMALFQAGFTVGAYFLASTVSGRVESVDHWIAFGLLVFFGGRMTADGLLARSETRRRDITKPTSLITMAAGTSIDALAVGISLALLNVTIWLPGAIIGVVTFLSSMIAIRIGKGVGKRFGAYVEVAGGLILMGIGIKILIEHTFI